MVYFDDVLVPWERVFLMNDVELANRPTATTGAVLHMAHQVVNLKIAKTEAFLGIDAGDRRHDRHRRSYQHVQEMIAEIDHRARDHEGAEGRLRSGRHVNEYGVMTPARGPLDAARNYYPSVYQRMVEILRLITSSGLIMIPTEADFDGRWGRRSRSTSARPVARPTTASACSGWRGT